MKHSFNFYFVLICAGMMVGFFFSVCAPALASSPFSDSFDTYTAGVNLAGQGPWFVEGTQVSALVSDTFSQSPPNSILFNFGHDWANASSSNSFDSGEWFFKLKINSLGSFFVGLVEKADETQIGQLAVFPCTTNDYVGPWCAAIDNHAVFGSPQSNASTTDTFVEAGLGWNKTTKKIWGYLNGVKSDEYTVANPNLWTFSIYKISLNGVNDDFHNTLYFDTLTALSESTSTYPFWNNATSTIPLEVASTWYTSHAPAFLQAAGPSIVYNTITGLAGSIFVPVLTLLSSWTENLSNASAEDFASTTAGSVLAVWTYGKGINQVFANFPIFQVILLMALLITSVLIFKGVWYILKLIR
jgi:hypothetical protein